MRSVDYSLTDKQLRALKYADRPVNTKTGKPVSTFKVTDGGGLFVRISPKETKTFSYTYVFKGRMRELTLGNFPEVSLATARERHAAARASVAAGHDPGVERKAAKLKDGMTFERVAEAWMKHNESDWGTFTRARTRELLELYAYPKFGKMPIEDVKPTNVRLAIQAKAHNPTTAAKLRSILQRVFRYAAGLEMIASNPAASMDEAVKVPPVKNHPHLLEPHIGPWWNLLADSGAHPATIAAAKFIAYTWCRKGEVLRATWGEIEGLDGDNPVFVVPAERTKMKRVHVVPLPPQAVAVLRDMALGRECGHDDWIFSRTGKHPINHTTLNGLFGILAERLGAGRFPPHGLRSTGASLLGERGVSTDLIELLLAHRKKGIVGVYNRSLLLDQRRDALEFYAETIEALAAGSPLPENPYAMPRFRRKSGNVVQLTPAPRAELADAA